MSFPSGLSRVLMRLPFGKRRQRHGPRHRVTAGALALASLVAGLTWLPAPPHSSLSLSAGTRDDPAVNVGARGLSQALAEVNSTGTRERSVSVTGGLANDPEIRGALAGRRLPAPAEEGYVIQPLPGIAPDAPLRVVVAGGSPLGLAYGLLALGEGLRLDRSYLRYPVAVSREPAVPFRLTGDPLDPGYPGAELALRQGFNAVLMEPWPALALYDGFDPAIYGDEGAAEARRWVEERRERAREQVRRAKELRLKIIAPGDLISLPPRVLQLYGSRVADASTPPQYCMDRPLLQEVLAAGIDEVFRDFPEIDGIMVRTGENYPLGPLSGNPPQDAACGAGGSTTDGVAAAARFMREQVVQKHGRLLIQRAWDLGADGYHASSTITAQLAAALGTGENVMVSFKATQTDFWRYNALNANLAGRDPPRMIELQAAREYEGKGAFPNYVGGLYGRGLPEAEAAGGLREAYWWGVRAAWVWPRGGGWGGPRIHSDLWLDANVYALSHLLWDPLVDPDAVARDWSRLRFGEAAAPAVTALLLRSPDAVLDGLYFRCFAADAGPWNPNALWVRDDIIAGAEPLERVYQACRSPDEFDAVLEEKRRAVASVDAMLDTFLPAEPLVSDKELVRQVVASLSHERALLATLRDYATGMFQYFRYRDSRGRDREAARSALGAFAGLRVQWDEHLQVAGAGGFATPYRDGGMLAAVAAAERDLGRR